jgi:hypothetical protein
MTPPAAATPRTAPWAWIAAWSSLLLLGALVRWPGLFAQLWLDELWSLMLVSELDSPLGVFTAVHHDNNHWLNSLWLFALGDEQPAWAYHAPAWLAGVGTCALFGALGGWLGRRGEGDPRLEVALASLLGGVCYPLVVLGSEARGYSSMLCFGLLSVWSLVRYAETGRVGFAIGYALAGAFAFLSHLTYLHLFAGTALWAIHVVRREPGAPRRLVDLHLIPLAALGLLWLIDLRHLEFGGGPRSSIPQVIVWTASVAAGGPEARWLVGLVAGCVAVVVALELRALRADRRGEWVLMSAAIAYPMLVTAISRPPFVHPRYFLIPLAVLQLILVSAAGRALRAGGWRRVAAGVLLGLIVVGHARRVAAFFEVGRGQYVEALTLIAERSRGPATVSSDDVMTRMLVEHHARGLTPPISFVMEEDVLARGEGTDWWITGWVQGDGPPATATGPLGERYAWVASFRSTSMSGTPWHVYERARD